MEDVSAIQKKQPVKWRYELMDGDDSDRFVPSLKGRN